MTDLEAAAERHCAEPLYEPTTEELKMRFTPEADVDEFIARIRAYQPGSNVVTVNHDELILLADRLASTEARAVKAEGDHRRLLKEYDKARIATGVVKHPDGGPECDGCGCSQLSAEECIAYLVVERDALAAEVATLKGARAEWMPIESAPTSGNILIFGAGLPWPATCQEDGIYSNAHGRVNNPLHRHSMRATHWMPMIELPSIDRQNKGAT